MYRKEVQNTQIIKKRGRSKQEISHRKKPLVIIDFNEQLLEKVVPKGVHHHLREVWESFLENCRHRVLLIRVSTDVAIRGAVWTLVKLLLKQAASNLIANQKHRTRPMKG